MGGANAPTTGVGKPLIAQRNFEGTIHRRFIKDTVVTLEFHDQFWSQPRDFPLEIKDIAHDKVLFKVPPVSGDVEQPKRKLLLDAYGVPVVGMEEHEIPPTVAQERQFVVIPDGFAATKELLRFETRFNMSTEMRLTFELPDHTRDAPSRVVVMGMWLSRESAIAIQRRGGDFYMIARTYPSGSLLDGVYRMDVAPGVDLALMVLFAAAMDQEYHKYARPSERYHVKKCVKIEAKREKKQLKAQQKLEKKQASRRDMAATAS